MREPQEIASVVAMRRLKVPPHQIDQMDWQDMVQEAAAAMCQFKDRGERYAFRCGVNAAIQWFIEYRWGVKRHDLRVTEADTRRSDRVSLDALTGDETEFFDSHIVTDEARDSLCDDQIKHLVSMFLSARKRGGQRAIEAALRDARIVALVCAGYENDGIAQEIGIPASSVKRYRTRIRKILAGLNHAI